MRFAAVARLVGQHQVARACRLLGVSRSGYHRWSRSTPSRRLRQDRLLKQQILEEHAASRGRYGTPRIERSLRRKGIRTSRERVARLRREMELRARGVAASG